MKFYVFLGILTCFLVSFALSKKTYERCELARELYSLGLPKSQLPDWLCLIEHESTYRTWVTHYNDYDGSIDNGLYQINSAYWCKAPTGPSFANVCKTPCDSELKISIYNIL